MNIQELIEARNVYKECYKEAKQHTFYKNKDPNNDKETQILRDLREKSWRCEDALFPVVLIGLLIAFLYMVTTDRNTLIDACVLFTLLIGGILVRLNLIYWMNKYRYLLENLVKARRKLDDAEEEYKNTRREYKEGIEPIHGNGD